MRLSCAKESCTAWLVDTQLAVGPLNANGGLPWTVNHYFKSTHSSSEGNHNFVILQKSNDHNNKKICLVGQTCVLCHLRKTKLNPPDVLLVEMYENII